jgi:hypothetical protein
MNPAAMVVAVVITEATRPGQFPANCGNRSICRRGDAFSAGSAGATRAAIQTRTAETPLFPHIHITGEVHFFQITALEKTVSLA